jgi:ribosomal protein S26
MEKGHRVFLWAAIGHKDTPPGRIEVVICEHCAVVIPIDRADRHIRWHRLLDYG